MSPTARSLKLLRQQGYIADIVEKTVPYKFIKQDLFDCIDIVGVRGSTTEPEERAHVIMVQATSTSNVMARVKKMKGIAAVGLLKLAHVKVEVWGWSKKGPRGKRKLWCCRVVEL